MQDGGRISAAIEVLADVISTRNSVKGAVRNWGRNARYAGSKDRAWISGLVLESLRRKNSASWIMNSDSPRSIVLGTLRIAWNWSVFDIEDAFDATYAPFQKLTENEKHILERKTIEEAPVHIQGDYPAWLSENISRVFETEEVAECQALAQRADVGLRINTLKISSEDFSRKFGKTSGVASLLLTNAYRIPATAPTTKGTSLDRIPAYSKGFVEVQDEGSQISVCSVNAKPGEKVLDYCAGAGGKTLALAAMMSDTGSIYAHDRNPRRLSMMLPRLKKSGAKTIELITRGELQSKEGEFDCVLADVPCTGTGTWRRKPESKWLLTKTALKKRIAEQNQIIRSSSKYVKPGGRLIYITCSFLKEEAEDRIKEFLSSHSEFTYIDAAKEATSSGQLTEHGAKLVLRSKTEFGGVRLTPRRANTDGFFFVVLKKRELPS